MEELREILKDCWLSKEKFLEEIMIKKRVRRSIALTLFYKGLKEKKWFQDKHKLIGLYEEE